MSAPTGLTAGSGVNDLLVVPGNEDKLFVATDGGVYYTINGGVNWNRLGANMPILAVYDIELNTSNSNLIAGTFARSIWTIDINEITGIAGAVSRINLQIFPNPVNDLLQITMPVSGQSHITILDAQGKVMLSQDVDGNATTVKLSLIHI